MAPVIDVERRLDALTDTELLDEFAELLSAVLSRVNRYEVEGLDPDYHDRPPDAGKLNAGLAFAAMAEALTDHVLSGADEMPLAGWHVGLGQLRNELAWKARLVGQGEDPRV